MSQRSHFHCQGSETEKSVKPKARFWRAPGQESHGADAIILPACTYLVWTENLHILFAHIKQEQSHRKPEKKIMKTCQNSRKRMCFTEKKLENLHKSKISLLRTAALLQHRKNREVFGSCAFSWISQAQEGKPGRGSKLCALFPPHLPSSIPGCTLRRNATQDDNQQELSSWKPTDIRILCCPQRRRHIFPICAPSPHILDFHSIQFHCVLSGTAHQPF